VLCGVHVEVSPSHTVQTTLKDVWQPFLNDSVHSVMSQSCSVLHGYVARPLVFIVFIFDFVSTQECIWASLVAHPALTLHVARCLPRQCFTVRGVIWAIRW
jgi:hypothetical protein